MTQRYAIQLPQKPVTLEIAIGEGIVHSPLFVEALQRLGKRFAIITDSHVGPLYAEKLPSLGKEVYCFTFPAGERSKTRATKEVLEDQLLAKGIGRDSVIIALGGGVATDLAGYLAATFNRGLPLVMVPTSLLAMVDASIGGKNGVNTPAGKNLIGTTYQPTHIFIDTMFLKQLPLPELKNGLVEMIKHGAIADKRAFDSLKQHAEQLFHLPMPLWEQCISESCAIKQAVVEEDERESGKRRILNFGHTIGHALELALDYCLPHGQAVALGMLAEAWLAVELRYLPKQDYERLHRILNKFRIPVRQELICTPAQLRQAMAADKKAVQNQPRIVMLQAIGSCHSFEGAYCTPVPEETLQKALHWLCYDLCRIETP